MLKISFRAILKGKIFSIINILGLSIGLTCSILIMLWVQDELSFDKFHKNYNTIYRIVANNAMLATPQPMAPVIKDEIIGVIKNYHYETAHQLVAPTILWMNTDINYQGFGSITIRINPFNRDKTLKYAMEVVQQYNNGYNSEYRFIDSDFDGQYYLEKRLSLIFGISSALAIFISCIGLFALISFVIGKRTKEIGIRKINGASIPSILELLSKNILILVSIAFVLASPVAWYVCNKWLQNFAYRTNISWWLFMTAGAIALVIALLTVSFQSYKAAVRNPVKSLKYE